MHTRSSNHFFHFSVSLLSCQTIGLWKWAMQQEGTTMPPLSRSSVVFFLSYRRARMTKITKTQRAINSRCAPSSHYPFHSCFLSSRDHNIDSRKQTSASRLDVLVNQQQEMLCMIVFCLSRGEWPFHYSTVQRGAGVGVSMVSEKVQVLYAFSFLNPPIHAAFRLSVLNMHPERTKKTGIEVNIERG